jgi:hypothetical protein
VKFYLPDGPELFMLALGLAVAALAIAELLWRIGALS